MTPVTLLNSNLTTALGKSYIIYLLTYVLAYLLT